METENHETFEDCEAGEYEESIGNVMEDFFSEEADSDPGPGTRDLFDEESSDDALARREKPYGKKFSIASHIDIIRESSSTYYFCTICQRYFSHRHTARNHEFCGSGEKPFKCKLCDRRFVKKCDRDSHHLVHTGERPFVCSICDKSFRLKHKLSRHMRYHLGIKGGDHKCALCPRSFITKVALRKHEVNKHNPRKSIQCKSCKKFFERNEERAKHKCIKPTRKKNLVCEICGKMFNKNWNLVVHRRIHLGQRPFKCEECKKSFTLRQHLDRHSAKHQTDADFECMLCKLTFGRKDNMIRHLKLNHPDRHLGLELRDMLDRSEKSKTYKESTENSSKLPEDHLRPTVIAVNNFPNIRFVKMPPKPISDDKTVNKSSEDPQCVKVESVSYKTGKDVSAHKEKLSGVEDSSKNSVVVGSVIRSSVLTASGSAKSSIPVPIQRPVTQSVISHATSHNTPNVSECKTRHHTQGPDVRRDASETRVVSCHSLPAQVPVPRGTSYLPVSVLRFKSSSELRTAVPKKPP